MRYDRIFKDFWFEMAWHEFSDGYNSVKESFVQADLKVREKRQIKL